MRLPEPFSCFCRDDNGKFDYHEWHAIECGIGDALSLAGFARGFKLHRKEWHYYIVARGVTTACMILAAVRLLKR